MYDSRPIAFPRPVHHHSLLPSPHDRNEDVTAPTTLQRQTCGVEGARMAVDVLLVAADAGLGTVLEIALAADGYRVRRVATAADAGAALAAAPPDVLIVDT